MASWCENMSEAQLWASLHDRLAGTPGVDELVELQRRVTPLFNLARRQVEADVERYGHVAAWRDPATVALHERETRESCGSCGADIGPSSVFPWHLEDEDCRAVREPLDTVHDEHCWIACPHGEPPTGERSPLGAIEYAGDEDGDVEPFVREDAPMSNVEDHRGVEL